MNIDITMTATIRPKIIEETLRSFTDNLFSTANGINFRLIINVDPCGSGGSQNSIVDIARKYFKDIVVNTPSTANFSKAFKWVWDSVDQPDYVFHLEDDWRLNRRVNMGDLISILSSNPTLAILRLGAFCATNKVMKNWNQFYPWNGEYYKCPDNLKGGLGFAGHPSLIKTGWVNFMRRYLDGIKNPEKALKYRPIDKIGKTFILLWDYGVYGVPGTGPLVSDIGRSWMIKNGLRKSGNKAFFTEWENTQ